MDTTSSNVASKLLIEKVLPDIVKVPVDILFCNGKSFNLKEESKVSSAVPIGFPKPLKYLFLEVISVLDALLKTCTENSPVNESASALTDGLL